MNKFLERWMPIWLLMVVCFGAQPWMTVHVFPPVIVYLISFIVLFVYAAVFIKDWRRSPMVLRLFLGWVLINALRGLLYAEGYYDFKFLVENLTVYLIPLCVVYFSRPENVQKSIRLPVMASMFMLVFFYPISFPEASMRLLFLLPLLVPFVFRVNLRQAGFVILMLIAFAWTGSLESRAAITRMAVSLFFAVVFLLPPWFTGKRFLGIVSSVFFTAPIVLLVAAGFYDFNIFVDTFNNLGGKYIIKTTEGSQTDQEDLAGDTRTFIYEETLVSATLQDYWLMGHTLSRGYTSPTFRDTDPISFNRGERPNSEVGILNIFTHMGLIGVVLYTIVFLMAAYRALTRARSPEMRVMGALVAFRWFLSWTEEFTIFDINQNIIWLMVAMCLSTEFLEMDGPTFRKFLSGCFYKVTVGAEATHRTIGER